MVRSRGSRARTARASRRCSRWRPGCCGPPRAASPCSEARSGRIRACSGTIGYVAEDAPLYRSFTVGDVVEYGRRTNRRWDGCDRRRLSRRAARRTSAWARSRPAQRARVALAVALGKQPLLLLVDEPFARLDPRAGREFLQLLMEGVAETGGDGRAGDARRRRPRARLRPRRSCSARGAPGSRANVDDLLASHRLLSGARRPLGTIAGVDEIVRESYSGRQMTLLVRAPARDRGPLVVGRRGRPGGAPARVHGARRDARAAEAGDEVAAVAWVTWRQHRVQLLVSGALLGALLVAAAATGLPMHSAYGRDSLASCLPPAARSGCEIVVQRFEGQYASLADSARYLIVLPVLAALFVGVPLLTRELEHGTYRFAWTQTITRTRWLLVKFALLGLAAVAAGVVLSLTVSWWRRPFDELGGRMSPAGSRSRASSCPRTRSRRSPSESSPRRSSAGRCPRCCSRSACSSSRASPCGALLRPRFQEPLHETAPGIAPVPRGRDWILHDSLVDAVGRVITTGREDVAIRHAQQAGHRPERLPRRARVAARGHLPAERPLLDVPGARGGPVRRARRRLHRSGGLDRAAAAPRVTTKARTAPSSCESAALAAAAVAVPGIAVGRWRRRQRRRPAAPAVALRLRQPRDHEPVLRPDALRDRGRRPPSSASTTCGPARDGATFAR